MWDFSNPKPKILIFKTLKYQSFTAGVDSEEELENATTSEHIQKILQARSALYERHFDIRIWPR